MAMVKCVRCDVVVETFLICLSESATWRDNVVSLAFIFG